METVNNTLWVARDKDGTLCSYLHKPIRNDVDNNWWDMETAYDTINPGMYYEKLDSHIFPELTWDDEPIELAAANLTID